MCEFFRIDSLREFTKYSEITIQCHNYPDADTLGSGFALYQYFKECSQANVRLVYGGFSAITKTNLVLMLEKIIIPIEHITTPFYTNGLLITVDCQYGSSNVFPLDADNILIIDHHRISKFLTTECSNERIYTCIKENYGSCASVVYQLFQKDGYVPKLPVSTALYYGLYMDTNDFSEVREPADRESRDELVFDDAIFTLIKNSNLNPRELIIAGAALQHYQERGSLAFIEAEECDPNILGLIADMLIRVENVTTAIVFNRLSSLDFDTSPSYKFSVRSCVGEVRANELAELIVSPIFDGKTIGGGGGHRRKAGGRVDVDIFNKWSASKPFSGNFAEYLCCVFSEYSKFSQIIYCDTFDFNSVKHQYNIYKRKPAVLGYVRSTELAAPGCRLLLRTRYGDVHEVVREDLFIKIGLHGDINTISRHDFHEHYEDTTESMSFKGFTKYEEPRIVIEKSGTKIYLKDILHPCKMKTASYVYVRRIKEDGPTLKLVASKWAYADFKFGNIGDYILVNADDHQDVTIMDPILFSELFE